MDIQNDMNASTIYTYHDCEVDFLKMPEPSLKLALTPDEIHIWYAVLDISASELCGFAQTLSAEERMRAGRFHFQKDQNRFIARHGMLRMILGSYMGVKAGELRFNYGKHGKPEFTETSDKGIIRFNLSHSEGVALFAFACGYEVGVDVELIRDISEMEQIVDQFFSAREKAFFRALPHDMKKEAFFNCWTRKEAFIKAIGKGLSYPLDEFDSLLLSDDRATTPSVEREAGGVSDWSIHSLRPAAEYVGAIAVRNKS